MLRAAGIGNRATPADVLIFGRDGVMGNTLRFNDECARHKVLDMVGDLSLLGMDLHGFVVAHRSGHHTNAALVRRLLQGLEKEKVHSSRVPSIPVREDGTIDIRGILDILPHRYPLLLVDRVLEIQAGKSIVAIKNVSANEPFFQGHWPGRPIMPGVLIIEAMAQAGGILVAATMESLGTSGNACIGGQGQAPPASGARRSAPSRSDSRTHQAKLRLGLRHRQGRRRGCGRGQDPVYYRRRSSCRVRGFSGRVHPRSCCHARD